MTAIVNWVGGSIGCLFSYFFSNATPQDKALEAIAKVTNLSKKVISQDRCFEAVQEAFKRKDWNLLDNIAEVLDDLTSSDGTTLFQALICDKSFKYTDKLKQCKSVSNFLKQAELWRIEAKPETKPAFSDHPPENLVFQGGGATGIAHVGALRKLEEKNLISNVKRTAGTSAGSILAALLAVGYTSLELEQELSKDFFEFFDHTSLIGSACLDASFSGPSVNKIFFKLLTLIKKHGIKAAMNPKKFWKELADFKGCCKGDKLRDWFEELIFRKTGIKHCTFGELALLTRKKSSQFKHLHVFVTKVEGELKTVRISSEDQNFKKVIISDAILASACIPGVFEPHVLHEKSHEYGVRIPAKHHGTFLDGGVSYNFPLEAFDKKEFCLTDELDAQEKEEYYFNPKTMGFSLHSPLSTDINFTNITNVRDLINMLYLVGFTIYSAENSLRETILSKNKLRTVSIR
ncbi:MAG: patatin-like phospholipase family protein [Simkania sp.]|nr:patatin-like phospholipase family protein [Simkania sp.]MCB9093371.1 patatin-like phospholipase family protein [Halobacteriovoraceae bacterium]